MRISRSLKATANGKPTECYALYKQIDRATLEYCLPLWLDHFNNQDSEADKNLWNFKTPQAKAEREAVKNLDKVIRDDPQDRPQLDYREIVRDHQLTGYQIAGIFEILREAYPGLVKTVADKYVPPTQVGGNIFPVSGLHPFVVGAAKFLEAVCVQLEVGRLKGETYNLAGRTGAVDLVLSTDTAAPASVECTHDQLLDIIKLRHGGNLLEEQLRRLKHRFVTRSSQCDPTVMYKASKVEVLVEEIKGVPGLASRYALADTRLLAVPVATVSTGTGDSADTEYRSRGHAVSGSMPVVDPTGTESTGRHTPGARVAVDDDRMWAETAAGPPKTKHRGRKRSKRGVPRASGRQHVHVPLDATQRRCGDPVGRPTGHSTGTLVPVYRSTSLCRLHSCWLTCGCVVFG